MALKLHKCSTTFDLPYRFHSHDEDHVHGVPQVLDGGDGSAGFDPDSRPHPGLVDPPDQSLGVVAGGFDVEGVLGTDSTENFLTSILALTRGEFSRWPAASKHLKAQC